MECQRVVFSGHAAKKMFQRSITPEEVRAVISTGEVIEEYPEDYPFSSKLVLGSFGGRFLHVVYAPADPGPVCYVITTYEPDPDLWDETLKRRRTP